MRLSVILPKAPGLLQTRLIQAKGPGPLTRDIWAALFFQSSRSCASPAEKPGASSEDDGSVPDLHYFSLSSEIATELSLVLLLALSCILNCNHTPFTLPTPPEKPKTKHIQAREHPIQLLLCSQDSSTTSTMAGLHFGSDFHKTQVAPLKPKPSQK